MNEQVASINQVKNTIIDLAIRFGPRVLIAIVILLLGAVVSRWVSRWAARGLGHLELEPPVRSLLARTAWGLTFALFLVLALQNLGVELLPLIAGVSVVGAGVALATQGVIGNLVAGLSIIFTKPFRVGEYISIVGEEGVVDAIALFSTKLRHIDQRTIREVLESNPHVLKDPPAVVQANQLADWSIVIAVRPWVPVQYFVCTTGEINHAIVELFRNRGVPLAVPQREVRLIGASPD